MQLKTRVVTRVRALMHFRLMSLSRYVRRAQLGCHSSVLKIDLASQVEVLIVLSDKVI